MDKPTTQERELMEDEFGWYAHEVDQRIIDKEDEEIEHRRMLDSELRDYEHELDKLDKLEAIEQYNQQDIALDELCDTLTK